LRTSDAQVAALGVEVAVGAAEVVDVVEAIVVVLTTVSGEEL
jgi:hypothetical protein